MGIHGYTRVYKGIQWIYNGYIGGVQGYTRVYNGYTMGIQWVYMGILGYT